ncbi:hypothetical protein HYG86_15130 [Alkalicella caledoniensis]|uniref:Uncharacterized protein n=1 Tax=Alkalicella caledoniensis TaxID=2731377 RepID=A0A7G9WBE3_ALKCA|nr:hypothetical protein [Alkalicella caledoniensis]QNO16005.1 hypothetical protein HYG86_15130 [Alkalicella caledoniensis]
METMEWIVRVIIVMFVLIVFLRIYMNWAAGFGQGLREFFGEFIRKIKG